MKWPEQKKVLTNDLAKALVKIKYPESKRRTYEEYVDEMQAYGFAPMKYDLWNKWETYYRGEDDTK